jgi:hypothetical protein
MLLFSRLLLGILLLTPLVGAQSLTTLYNQNNGGSQGGNVYFQVVVTSPTGIVVTAMDTNCRNQTSPTYTLDVYITDRTYQGKEASRPEWTQVSTGQGKSAAANMPARVDLDDFFLAPGSYGMALTHSLGHGYTNGTGSNQKYTNQDLTLNLGTATNIPFTGNVFGPRIWNGTIHYQATGLAGYGIYGTGCKGSNGIPLLQPKQGSLPKLGGLLQLELTNLPLKQGPVFLINGFNKDKYGPLILPFDLTPLGFTGCTLQVAMIWTTGGINLGGKGTVQFPIPLDPVLQDAWFFNQALSMDQGAGPTSFIFSNGGAGRIGK